MSFSFSDLSPALADALNKLGYATATPIQEQAIPAILNKQDVIGIAKTGSGKTVSYVLPVLMNLATVKVNNRHAAALVVVPTRELAVQVNEVFQQFNSAFDQPVKTMAVYGGVSINPQMIKLQGVQVLIATPGRLLELVESNSIHLSEVKILVLDEADKMLNLGFKDELDKILALLPKKKQTLLFSATLNEEVTQMHSSLLVDPLLIQIETAEDDIELIEQTAYAVTAEQKGPLLRYLIRHFDMKQVLVFTSSVYQADNVTDKLNKNGIEARAIHSKKSQGARTEALNRFKAGKTRVLVSTDLLARGIDIDVLPFVINYELPRSPKDYIHRIGRTGRAGASGEAISLIAPDELHHFSVIQKKMKKRVTLIDSEELDLKGA